MNLFDISNTGTEVCNKYMNSDHADTIEKKTDKNSYRVEIYQVIINKLKNK